MRGMTVLNYFTPMFDGKGALREEQGFGMRDSLGFAGIRDESRCTNPTNPKSRESRTPNPDSQ